MKLFIQIPCYNEEETLSSLIKELPKQIDGIDQIETLIIDDGCTDGTVESAKKAGVSHVLSFAANQGLAHAFRQGLDFCLRHGADIIVNIDGDNQYPADQIPTLITPVMDGTADFVVGVRPIRHLSHFSLRKKWLQRLGSYLVRVAAEVDVNDTTSGFRAMSRAAAIRMTVLSEYTYTLETLLQAKSKRFVVKQVPIRSLPTKRPSRLMNGLFHYIRRSANTIIRTYTMYQPLKVFLLLGASALTFGLLIGLRFLFFYLVGQGQGHIQSLILASILIILGFVTVLIGMLSDLLSANRKLLEEILVRVRRLELRDNDKEDQEETLPANRRESAAEPPKGE